MNPRLDRVLRSGGRTVETLSEQNELLRASLRHQEAEERSLILREMEDYRQAVWLATGGWLPRLPIKESGQVYNRIADNPAFAIKESDSCAVVQCKERLLELELALEDRSWKRLEAQSRFEFSRWGIQQIILICRLYRIKNPIIQRGILVSTYYVIARGVEISCDDEDANEVLQKCLKDPRNASELSVAALAQKEAAKYTDGNIFWCWFKDPEDGMTIFRHIDPVEIEEIITDPDDSTVPWFYHRRWTQQKFNPARGAIELEPRDEWYVAYGHEDDIEPGFQINGKPLMQQGGEFIPVYHRKEGALDNWLFGCPRAYAALDWARARRELLEDYCSRIRALSRYAYDIDTKGGPPAMAGWKQQTATTLANDLESIEQQPPPVTASTIIHGPGTKITPMRTGGLSETPEESQAIAQMAYMVFGLPDTFFSDSQRGNLATAASLDRPTELKFLFDQEIWKFDLSLLAGVILKNSMRANSGKLRESLDRRQIKVKDVTIEMQPVKLSPTTLAVRPVATVYEAKPPKNGNGNGTKIQISVKFPAILEGDIPQRINAIVQAMTMNGFETTGIDERVGVELMLTELLSFGFEFDIKAILDSMYPLTGKDKYDPLRTQEDEPPLPAQPAPGATGGAITQNPAQQQGAPAQQPKAERTARPKRSNQEAARRLVLDNLIQTLKAQEARLREAGRIR